MAAGRHFRRILLYTGLVFSAASAFSVPASAFLATYTYTASWSSWMDSSGLNRALYADLDSSGIHFVFTVSAPLVSVGCGTNPYSIYCQSDIKNLVQSWHYNGGSDFLDVGSDVPGSTLTGLLISTDANGNILNDRFYLNGPVVIPTLENETSSLVEAHDGYDQQNLYSTFARLYQGSPITLSEGMSNFGGSWSVVINNNPDPSPVPEPATYTLILAGLGLAGAVAARRKAKQVP